MAQETRVGYAATSIMEQTIKEYIDAHTEIKIVQGKEVKFYKGDIAELIKYQALVEYNRR